MILRLDHLQNLNCNQPWCEEFEPNWFIGSVFWIIKKRVCRHCWQTGSFNSLLFGICTNSSFIAGWIFDETVPGVTQLRMENISKRWQASLYLRYIHCSKIVRAVWHREILVHVKRRNIWRDEAYIVQRCWEVSRSNLHLMIIKD